MYHVNVVRRQGSDTRGGFLQGFNKGKGSVPGILDPDHSDPGVVDKGTGTPKEGPS